MRRWGPLSMLLLAFCAAQAREAALPQAEVHPRILQDASAHGAAEFLIVLDRQADLSAVALQTNKQERGQQVFEVLTDVASRTQPALTDWLEQRGIPYRAYWITNMVWARADLSAIDAIAARGDVRRLDANPFVRVKLPSAQATPRGRHAPSTVSWGILHTNADQVWAQGYTGSGVVVAGQDTGFEWDHPALINQYRGWNGVAASHDYNWHDAIHGGGGDCGPDSAEPCDDIDHGTHTMGTMVGDNGGTQRIGMAPGARWIGCRNMDEGVGTAATYAECFQWFVAPTDIDGNNPDPDRAPDVIGNSWSCPVSEGCSPATLQTVVANTRAAGIVVVAAATNYGDACNTIDEPPAIYDEALTIGATNAADDIWHSSSRGPVTVDGSGRIKPDVSAPGVLIRSSVRNGGYSSLSGTSVATPHVVGLIALLLDARPDLRGQPEVIETIVRGSVVPLTSSQDCGGVPGSEVPNPVYGHGRIDALQALFGDPDNDGVDNLHDCAPIEGSAWAGPGPAAALTLGKAPTETILSWSEPTAPGADVVSYDVLRSGDAYDFASPTCIASNIDGTSDSDSDRPVTVFYYLVRAQNACGDTLGTGTDATPRAGGACPNSP